MSDPQRIVGSVDITNNLSDKRGIKISFYIVEGEDDRPSMNRLIDAAMDVVDRQVIRSDIVAKRAELAMWRLSLENLNDNYDGLMNKKKVGSLTSQEKLEVGKFNTDLRTCKRSMESLEAAIRAAEKKLAEEMGA